MRALYYFQLGCVLFLVSLFSAHLTVADEWIYTTSKGDTLWDFSQKYLHHVHYWAEIKKINNIAYPKRLQPNQRLRVPLSWVKVNPVAAKLISVYGKVQVQTSGKYDFKSAQVGQLLHLGDKLSTAKMANVTIQFADNSLLTIHENSLAEFDHLTAYGDSGMVDSRLRLIRGRVDSRVKPALGAGSRFEIHTPSAISAVRGTEYRLSTDADKLTTNMEVLKGKVKIASANNSVMVPKGYGSKAEKGKAPIAARKLLEAPQILDFPTPIRQLNYPLSWQALAGAIKYRLEISTQSNFNQVQWTRVVAQNRMSLPDLEEGKHYLRLRGIDALDLEGLNTEHQIVIDVRPQAPILLQPAEKKVLRGKGPKLRWSESFEAHRYKLQVSSDSEFIHIIEERNELSGTNIDFSHLHLLQNYFWRIASIAADGEVGPFSLPRQFVIKPIPAQPRTHLVSDDEKINLTWQEGISAQKYEVQLAEDNAFQQIIEHQQLTQAEWVIAQETLLVRYFRVRLVEPDGYTGTWSTVQKIDPLSDDGCLYLFLPAALLIFLL